MNPDLVLKQVFEEGCVEHPDGHLLDVKANISQVNSAALREFVLRRRPSLAVEIGMGYGVSTLSILAALETAGAGRLISVDPYIGWPTGRLVALHQVARAALSHRHEHLHECSYTALPKLLIQGATPDFVYIDGSHNYDYVFTDCFFADKLVRPGGVVAFNDAGWRSVHKVIGFLTKYRRYRELEVGVPRVYTSRNPVLSLIKRVEGRSTYDRYFEKVEEWEPDPKFQHPLF